MESPVKKVQIDYDNFHFSFMGIRKHFFSDKRYNVYIFDNMIIIAAVLLHIK